MNKAEVFSLQMFAHSFFFCQVTILQRSRDPGRVESFSFLLDESASNTTIYITGNSLTFNLRSPTGKFRGTLGCKFNNELIDNTFILQFTGPISC